MGLISNLLKLRNTKNKTDYQKSDSYGAEITRCLIEIKLTKKEFEILMMEYYMGHTSYKSLLNPVFAGNPKKILMVIEKAKEKALDACNIDFTFIRFFSSEKKQGYIGKISIKFPRWALFTSEPLVITVDDNDEYDKESDEHVRDLEDNLNAIRDLFPAVASP